MRTKTFKNGNSEAVRLPREVTYGQFDLDLTITKTGDVVTIYPTKGGGVEVLIAGLLELPGPSEIQKRAIIEPPLRIDD